MYRWKKNATIGELYHPAMDLQTSQDAADYLEELIEWAVAEHGQTREEAREIQPTNLGYFAGYYDRETMERVFRIFGAEHPIFGLANVTPEQAFQAGVEMVQNHGKASTEG